MVKNKSKKRKHRSSDDAFNLLLLIFVTFCLLIVLYPLIFVLSSSFSSADAIIAGRVYLWPVDFTTKGYEMVFSNQSIWRATLNSLWIVVTNTIVSMILHILAAYALSRKGFQGRTFYQVMFLIPMYFSGGMIPNYLHASRLGLVNSLWGFTIMAGISCGSIIIIRTFFQSSIPGELLEAAKIDGITDIGYLMKIVLPLSKAVLATQILGMAVGNWNAYVNPMIYLRDKDIQPLQLILRQILASARVEADQFTGSAELLAEMMNSAQIMQYAVIVVTTFPIMIAIPLMQKYFKEGVLIGTLKG